MAMVRCPSLLCKVICCLMLNAVKYNHPQYIAKFQQIVVKDSELGSFFESVQGPIGLSSTSQYIRVINGYRYTNDNIRTGMQSIKRRALSLAFSLAGASAAPSPAKRKIVKKYMC
eukprot:gnl/Chilomastix_caulleri/4001.p2 GENE.gnl/Chilomastix_caulleri/4001~~gnl/Chilomastix_caulleri/4001.p2  ORF type:complete len:115 (+),score=10.80 gnl/Chilomastix_caulleri/4001:498-842(+)